jgi:rhamnosyltransferase
VSSKTSDTLGTLRDQNEQTAGRRDVSSLRRIAIYLFFDLEGIVDDYVLHKLTALREHVEHIHVVSNSTLPDQARDRLQGVADTVFERENVGFDVWAYKESLTVLGEEFLKSFDELIMMNYTFFGPVGSFGPVFEAMDARPEIDFWGLTEHSEVVPHPFQDAPVMHAHIQSHWIAVRRSMFTSEAFKSYWYDMPMITSYFDSVNRHEGYFTHHFEEAGFKHLVVFPAANYASQHPVMDNAIDMLRDGLPIVKRRLFFHDPLYLEGRSIVGREVVSAVAASGYPMDQMLSNLARTSPPRALVTNMGLLEVLPHHDLAYDASRPLRVAAVAHIYYVEMTDELIDHYDRLPSGYSLIVTTSDADKRDQIVQILADRGVEGDVRIVQSNRGRDISAFFLACRDIIESDDYDLIVKLHSKKSPQDGHNAAALFKRHLFENLLPSPGYAANVVALFQTYASLGLVMPPVIHTGYPTLGHSWFGNKEPAKKQAARLGIHVPFDDTTPVATYGSMFIARPAALRPILRGEYDWDDFPEEGEYGDGALSHVLERLIAYGALSEGYHVREVLNPDFAASCYRSLEFKLQALSAELPAGTMAQIKTVRRLRRFEHRVKKERRAARAAEEAAAAPGLTRAKQYLDSAWPSAADALRRPYRVTRASYRRVRPRDDH